MTGIAKRLEKNGFIVRKNDPDDDRIKRLQITPEGTEVLREIADHKERSVRQYLNAYSTTRRRVFFKQCETSSATLAVKPDPSEPFQGSLCRAQTEPTTSCHVFGKALRYATAAS